MKKSRNITLSFSLLIIASLVVQAEDPKASKPSDVSQGKLTTAIVVELPEVTDPEIKKSLEDSISEMRTAIREVYSFVLRKEAEKKKDHFWHIYEEVSSGTTNVTRRVNFESKEGPITLALKSVFEGEGAAKKELKDESYTIYYYPDGKIKSYLTRGSPQKELHFYPSGKIEQYDLVENEETIISGEWKEDGKVKHEEHKKRNEERKTVTQ